MIVNSIDFGVLFREHLTSSQRYRSTRSAARDTPIWKLEAALKRRSCRKGRYSARRMVN
jgi:hypothetical protein